MLGLCFAFVLFYCRLFFYSTAMEGEFYWVLLERLSSSFFLQFMVFLSLNPITYDNEISRVSSSALREESLLRQ